MRMIDVFGHETLKKEWSKYEIKAAKYVQDNNDISMFHDQKHLSLSLIHI